ncbi:MAG: hypothetical protein K6G55_06240 [Selenomonadaceae bacterium]|nr:hypothetical protein [Selenomonadaceae bacterium]
MLKKFVLMIALIFATATANCYAAESELPFGFVGTTYQQGDKNFLALVSMKSNKSLFFMVANESGKTVFVPYSKDLYEFYLKTTSDGKRLPIAFPILITNQERGQVDDNLGQWRDKSHYIPVCVTFDYKDGQVICEKPFLGATSDKPKEFNTPIQSQDTTNLIEVFMTKMPLLHKKFDADGVKLP